MTPLYYGILALLVCSALVSLGLLLWPRYTVPLWMVDGWVMGALALILVALLYLVYLLWYGGLSVTDGAYDILYGAIVATVCPLLLYMMAEPIKTAPGHAAGPTTALAMSGLTHAWSDLAVSIELAVIGMLMLYIAEYTWYHWSSSKDTAASAPAPPADEEF